MMNMKCRIESFNFSRLSDSPVPIATYTLYAIILVMSSIIHVPCDINKHVLNHMLPRSTIAGMSGRNQNWGRVPNRSQSFHNLLAGDETGQELRLHLSQSISASHSALRISSAEEGLELLGTAAEDTFSNFEETDTSLLDYDSDNQRSEQAVIQKETSAVMDMDQAAVGTDPGERQQETAEMDATYFQCRAARLSGHKDQLISVSRDDSFGRTVIVPSAVIGSFENHSNIAATFHGSRIMRGNQTVNKSLSASFDPGKLVCVSCATEHSILSKSPSVVIFLDQNFVPTLTAKEQCCISIVQIENCSLLELYEMA
jgi:hypothetical protein